MSVSEEECICKEPVGSREVESIVFAEASNAEMNMSANLSGDIDKSLAQIVWQNMMPSCKATSVRQPNITARKLDVMRAILSGKANPKIALVHPEKPYCTAITVSRGTTKMGLDRPEYQSLLSRGNM